MKYLLLILALLLPLPALADCSDIDGDEHVNACYQEGKLIPSEDNCPTVSNVDQRSPDRPMFVNNQLVWVSDINGAGVKCNYDINGDGVVTFADMHAMFLEVVSPRLPDHDDRIGDFDGDGNLSVDDYCTMQTALLAAGVNVGFINTICL